MQESNLDYVLSFQRHEWKYFFPNHSLQALIPELLFHMNLDPYSDTKDGFYELYSLYYDTQDWQSFYEKIDGIERRKKFRIRSYERHVKDEDTVFLEVKEKNKDIILKRRFAATLAEAKQLSLGKKGPEGNDVYDEWRYNIIRNSLKPKILIGYKRMAFIPKDNTNVRVTLDTDIKYAMSNRHIKFDHPLKSTHFTKKYSVLEIKYSGAAPKFIEDLIRRHNLRNEAISKFADSVMTNYKEIT